jgi:hypothetical protein
MSESQSRVIKLKTSPSRSKKDILRATLVEQLEELRGNFLYICETCEDALETHPEDMREWLSALESLNMHCTTLYGTGFFSNTSGELDLDDESEDR